MTCGIVFIVREKCRSLTTTEQRRVIRFTLVGWNHGSWSSGTLNKFNFARRPTLIRIFDQKHESARFSDPFFSIDFVGTIKAYLQINASKHNSNQVSYK